MECNLTHTLLQTLPSGENVQEVGKGADSVLIKQTVFFEYSRVTNLPPSFQYLTQSCSSRYL